MKLALCLVALVFFSPFSVGFGQDMEDSPSENIDLALMDAHGYFEVFFRPPHVFTIPRDPQRERKIYKLSSFDFTVDKIRNSQKTIKKTISQNHMMKSSGLYAENSVLYFLKAMKLFENNFKILGPQFNDRQIDTPICKEFFKKVLGASEKSCN